MLDILVFNVEHGQSIFFYPHTAPGYGMLVDCGNTEGFEPVDFLIRQGFLPHNGRQNVLGQLTLTNYDQDHFSGLPYLRTKASVKSIHFAKNLTSQEIKAQKLLVTDALNHVCFLQDTYIYDLTSYTPPYNKATFALTKAHLNGDRPTTNNLSQIVFVGYGSSVICIAGDLEKNAWEKLVTAYPAVKLWLGLTNVLVAGHHGRENGYAKEIFGSCSPECIILSDKQIVHGTQEGMSQVYANHVCGDGVALLSSALPAKRKVLTTRNDGHIWIRFNANGTREYRTFAI